MATAEADLNELMESAKSEGRLPVPKNSGIAKVSYTHEAMIDLLLANPALSQQELAAHFGYSASWICQILSSDAFQAKYAERAKDVTDPVVMQAVEKRFKALVLRSLEILAEKLERPSESIPDNLALRTFELASRAAGYGGKQDHTPAPAGDIHLHLEGLGGNLVSLLRKKRSEAEILDAEVISQ